MKKFITKTLSMILMLAMALSVTAMAASGNATPAGYEASANYHAYLDYRVTAGIKNSGYYLNWLDDMEVAGSYYDYKKLGNEYTSSIGGPIATYKYLLENFGSDIADTWATVLNQAIADYDHVQKHNNNSCSCVTSRVSPERANEFLEYLLSGQFDTDFAHMLATYGGKTAESFVNTSVRGFNKCEKQDWSTFLSNYITEANKATRNADDTYREGCLIPLNVINMAEAFANPLADAISTAIPGKHQPSVRKGIYEALYNSNLMPAENANSLSNGKTISTEKAVEIAKSIMLSDNPSNGDSFDMYGYKRVAAAINTARNTMNSNGSARNGTATTRITITADGKPVTLEAVILTNSGGGATTYFKIRDLAPIMDANVGWAGNIMLGSNKPYYTFERPIIMTTTTSDSRTTLVTVNSDTQLEAVILTDAVGGATTYFKIRDIAAILGYSVDWNAATGISVTDMYPNAKTTK